MPEQALFNHNQIISFICGIADECFRDVYVRGKYLNVILCLASALFSCVGQETISHFQNEDNRESLTFPQIGAFFIPLPSIEEQRQILDFIAGKINSIEDVIGNINKKKRYPE